MKSPLRTFRFQLTTIIATALVGIATAAGFTLSQPTTYSVEASAVVRVNNAKSIADLATGSSLAEQQAPTYARLATSSAVLSAVRLDLGRELSLADLQKATSVDSTTSTAVLSFSATSPKRALVAPIVNSMMIQLGREIARTARARTSPASGLVLDVTTKAEPPTSPTGPRILENLAVGGIVGFLAGLALLGILVNRNLSAEIADKSSRRKLINEA